MKNSETVSFVEKKQQSLWSKSLKTTLSKAIGPWITTLMKMITMLALKMAAFKFAIYTILRKIGLAMCNLLRLSVCFKFPSLRRPPNVS